MGRKLADLWDYADRLNKRFKCHFCKKDFPGGVVRLRYHLSGVQGGGIQLCTKVSEEAKNDALLSLNVVNKKRKTEPSSSDSDGGSSDICDPICNNEVGYSLAKFFLMAGINHDMVESSSFTNLIKALSPGSALPSSLELESKLIPSFKTEVEQYVSGAKQSWIETGCTLIPIYELNEKEGRSFLSIFGSSKERTVLLNTFEVPTNIDLVAPFLEESVQSVVQSVGSDNIVQCVVDGSECGAYFSSFLCSQFPHVSLTKCVARELQLLFEEICRDVGWVGTTFTIIKSIIDYICSDKAFLALMRSYTNGKELKQSLDFNFLSSYKMLEGILDAKEDLVQLARSPEWLASGYGAGQRGTEVTVCIEDPKTWELGEKVQKGLRSFSQVLCLVDSHDSSSGYLYGLIEIVEHSISQHWNDNQDMYQKLWDIYKSKKGQILSDFHIVAAFLNPAYMSTEQAKTADMNPVINHILGRFIAAGEREAFIREVYEYRKMLSDGSKPFETTAAKIYHPCQWWESCGQRLIILRRLATRMLSQPCNTSSCKSSMSTVEAVQIKQQRGSTGMKDLDLKLNAILMERFNTDKTYEREKIDLEEFSKHMSNNGSQGVFVEARCINGESTSSDRPLGMMDQPPRPKYQLHFQTMVPSTFTHERVKGENRSPICIYLVDPATNTVVRDGAPSVLTLTISVLDGNFNNEAFQDDQLSRDHFVNSDLRSTGKPLVSGDLQVTLVQGQGNLGDFWFNYNSHETAESEQVRIGVKTETGYCEGIRVLEGTSNAFFVVDSEVLRSEDPVSALHIPEDTTSYMQGELGYGSSCQLTDSDQASNVSMSGDLYDVIRWKSRAVSIAWAKVKAMMQWLLLWRAVQRKNEGSRATGGDVLKARKKQAIHQVIINQQDDPQVETHSSESMKIDNSNSSWKLTPLSLSIGVVHHKEDNPLAVPYLDPKLFGVRLTDSSKRKGTHANKFSNWTSLRMGLEDLVPPLDSTSVNNKKVSEREDPISSAVHLPKETISCMPEEMDHRPSCVIDESGDANNASMKSGLYDIRWKSKRAGIKWVKVKAMMLWTQVWRTVQRRTQKQLLERGTGEDVLNSTRMTAPQHCTINQQEDRVRHKDDDMQMTLQECCSKADLPLNISDIVDAKGSLTPMSDSIVTSTHFPFQITTDGASPTKEDGMTIQIEACESVKMNKCSGDTELWTKVTSGWQHPCLLSTYLGPSLLGFVDQRMTDNNWKAIITSRLHSTSSQGNKDTYFRTGATKVKTSSKRPSNDCYDVFLSFRGPDTFRGFTGELYQYLSRQGIQVFKDDKIGDLERAVENCKLAKKKVENCKMSIILLSKSYASNRQCLDELVMMLDKKKDIMPIYIGVTRDDMELKTNMFTDDLARHETKYGKELVQEWREAIKKVARIKGWELKDNISGSFVDLIEEVAREIQLKLKVKKKYEMKRHTKEDDIPAQLEACESAKMMDSSDFRQLDTPISLSIGQGVHENGDKPSVSLNFDLKQFGAPLTERSSQKSTSLENVSHCALSGLDPDDERMIDNICMVDGKASEDFASQLHSTSSAKNKGTAGEEACSKKPDVDSHEFDVFLCFTGRTRGGFSSMLRQSLKDKRIRIFEDDNELQDGEMSQAIQKAKICVPIFSKTFASGAWCLHQVEMMVKMKKTIVPIFYDVIPADVELKTIMYTDELAQHETRYGKELVQKWREALKEVGKMKGWERKDNMSFVNLTEKLAREIQLQLKRKEMSSEDFELQQLILNPSRMKFRRSAYIVNGITETRNPSRMKFRCNLAYFLDDLPKMRNMFCANAFGQDSPLVDYEDVSEKIVSICKESPLALKLVGCLLHGQGKPYWESKIQEMQNRRELVDAMPELELFSRNAFELDSPPVEYQHLCNEVVSLCKGNPLVLQLVGILLRGHGRQFWENKIKMMRENADEWVDLDGLLREDMRARGSTQRDLSAGYKDVNLDPSS